MFNALEGEGFILTTHGNFRDNDELYDEESCFTPTLSSLDIDSLPLTTQDFDVLANLGDSTVLSELESLSPFDEIYAGHAANFDHNSTEYWDYQDSFNQHLDRTYPADNGPATPCSQICENATVFEQPDQQLTNMGTEALCMEFPESVSALVFGGFESSRELSANGVSLGTGGWTNNLPPALNGGYCLTAPAGNEPWAWLSTW